LGIIGKGFGKSFDLRYGIPTGVRVYALQSLSQASVYYMTRSKMRAAAYCVVVALGLGLLVSPCLFRAVFGWEYGTSLPGSGSTVSLREIGRVPIYSDKPSGGDVRKLAWSPDGNRLALVLGWGFEILVLDVSTWREVCRLKWMSFQPERDVAFLSNTEIVTSPADNGIDGSLALAVYDSETGHLLREIPRPPQYARRSTESITTTWDRQIIATSVNMDTALFEARTGMFVGRVATPVNTSTTTIAGGPNRRLAVNVIRKGHRPVSDIQDEIYLVDATSNRVERTLRGHVPGLQSIAWSPNGKMVASGATMLADDGHGKWLRDPDPIRIWDTATGKLITSFAGLFDPISSISWNPSGRIIATVSAKGGKREMGAAVRLWSIEEKKMLFEYKTPGAQLVNGVTFNPKTGQLIWGYQGTLYIFQVIERL